VIKDRHFNPCFLRQLDICYPFFVISIEYCRIIFNETSITILGLTVMQHLLCTIEVAIATIILIIQLNNSNITKPHFHPFKTYFYADKAFTYDFLSYIIMLMMTQGSLFLFLYFGLLYLLSSIN
jgi:hypothetical protein